jgi:hypothetical protein
MSRRDPHLAAARLVADAGGEIIGRTRLQKIAYLAQLAGFGCEFDFEYRHYGPFSEDLARGMDIAAGLGAVHEVERQAGWGGWYSVYTLREPLPASDLARSRFLSQAKNFGAVELELAATAAFLFVEEHVVDPWAETRLRKPEKARDGRLETAMKVYEALQSLAPERLPPLPQPKLTREVTSH